MQKFIRFGAVLGILGILTFGVISSISAANININNGSFGTGSSQDDILGWEEKGNEGDSSTLAKSPENSGEDTASPDGGRFARIGRDEGQEGFICQQITTTGYQNLILSYYWRGDKDAEDNSDLGVVEFIKNGSCESSNNQWTTLVSHELDNGNTGVTSWSSLQSLNLPTDLNNTTFFLRFRGKVNSEGEDFRVDGINLSGDQIVSRTLNITKNGDGHITADSNEVNCGEDCDGTFSDGSVVTLTPNPATGWYFTGFSGDCTGTEPCLLTMDGNKTVVANFEEIKTTIVMTKVVCTTEADLPNWGAGGSDITGTTATDWVSSHPGCYLASDFNFEWALYSEPNPGDNVSTGGANWTSFGPTINNGVVSTNVVGQEALWVREKVSPYYLGFSGALSGQDDMDSDISKYSAELYCQNDVLNYDNYDYIEMPTKSDTVHCVAFNYEIDACPNLEGEQNGVPMGMHKVNGSCVPSKSTVNICKVDENQNPLSGWTLMLKGKNFQDNIVIPVADINGINTNNLLSGVSYLFKSSGTWMNQWGLNPVDTEYSQVNNAGSWVDQYPGIHGDVLELRINNQTGFWGSYNSDHKYARSIIPDSNGPANLGIFDGENDAQFPAWFADNENSTLVVDINEGYAGITGENGCTTFENVPYGTYIVDEIMQDGWENVSGISIVEVDSEAETFTVVNKLKEEEPPTQICTEKSMTVVSGTDDAASNGQSTVLSFVHTGWANIIGANWIWNTDGVTDPLQDETVTFSKVFNIPGNPISAVLEVLVDNSYTGSVNAFNSIGSTDENNFGQIDTYNLSGGDLLNGSNNISFTVKNWALANSTPKSNPAGLSYKLTVNYEECTTVEDDDEEEGDKPNTAPVIVLNGESIIEITQGGSYNEPGAVANDLEDGTGVVVTNISGLVDVNTPGSYQITYNYIDTGGMSATPVIRTVNVVSGNSEEEPPVDNDDEEEEEDNEDEENNTPQNNPPQNSGGGGGFIPLSFLGAPQNNEPQGQVLGESTTCGIYLDKFLRRGYKNNSDSVKKVQTFLNNYMGAQIPVTGFFGLMTESEVKKFQWKYKDEILTPWGLKSPTGIVYLTTTKKINEIMCPDLNLSNPDLIPFEENPESPSL